MEGGGPPSPADGPFACPICLEALRDPVTLPCGHNFCLRCLGAHRDGPAPGAPRCPLCQEPFPPGLRLRKNHALSELLQLRRPMAPGPEPEAEPEPEPEAGAGAGAGPQADAEGPVLCDVCPAGQAAAAARSCLVCLASFCSAHLQPHRASAAFRAHRLAPPLRRLEERLCRRHLRPLDAYCRACPAAVCPLCRAQDHRAHDVVPLEQERDLQEAQRPKILSDVENQLDELGVVIAQTRKTVELIKSTALKEKDIVSKLFAVATKALETFQKEVASFIEDDEQSMLAEAEEYLRQKEERRAKLAQCKQNLEQVSSTDALCFLQEFQALKIAAEENNSPGPSFQKELSFTKSSQVVCAVKELLVTACKSQWDQLLGKGADGAGFHDMQEVIAEPPLPDKPSNPACSETRDYFLKFAFIIDLDSDTADKFIQLFGTKGAKRVLNPIAYPESSTRFINCEQVLGENVMNRGNYYWEVEIIDGWVSIGVITDGFNSRESYDRGRLGRNEKSCCLQWNGQNYVAWFGGFESVIQQPFFHTIGVYLEYSEKALTFFGVKDSKMTCLQQLKVSRFKKGMFDPFQNKINHQFPSLFAYNLKPAFFLESVDAHLQLGPLKRDCVSVLKRR